MSVWNGLRGLLAPGRGRGPLAGSGTDGSPSPAPLTAATRINQDRMVDLRRRREELRARVAELQCDLGGLVYEMAVRDHIRVDLIVKRAAVLQDADAELSEVERIVRLEDTGVAGACSSCGAPHSTGASYCWQCGQPLLPQVGSDEIVAAG